MSGAPLYNAGTINLTGGSPVVIGIATDWFSAVPAGALLTIDGVYFAQIAEVVSNGTLRLALPWPGDDIAGSAYSIYPNPPSQVTPEPIVVSFNSSASPETILAGVTGKTIKVLAAVLTADSAVNLQFLSGVTSISGVLQNQTNLNLPFAGTPYYTTNLGDSLNLSAAPQVNPGGAEISGTIWAVQS